MAEKTNNLKKIILGILALSLVLFFFFSAQNKKTKSKLLVSGIVQAAEVQFGARQTGLISAVNASEGDVLIKGQKILSLEANQLKAKKQMIEADIQIQLAYIEELSNGSRLEDIESAKAQLEGEKADYHLKLKGNRQEEIKAAESSLNAVKAEYKQAKADYERKKTLFANELISQADLEQVQSKAESLENKVKESLENFNKIKTGFRQEDIEKSYFAVKSKEAQYKELVKGTRPEKLKAEKEKLESLKAKLLEINLQIAELEITSPCNCELNEFELRPGTLISTNQILGILIDLDSVWVEAYLPEEYYGKVHLGDKVEINSLSQESHNSKQKNFGKIKSIALKAEFTPRNIQTIEGRKQQVFKVKIALNNKERTFRPGMDLNLTFDFKHS
jgi:HlyD family secretion protein